MDVGNNVESKSQVEISLEKGLKELDNLSETCCIYSVPEVFRGANKGEAYTPQAISIGPYHLRSKNLFATNHYKMIYLKSFLVRTNSKVCQFTEMAEAWEGKVRGYYDEDLGTLKSEEMVKMIVMDGIFLVEFILRISVGRNTNDKIFNKPSLRDDIIHDLLLLENQLPLFVLKGFFNVFSKDDGDWIIRLYIFSTQYFSPGPAEVESINKKRTEVLLGLNSINTNDVKHLLDFFYVLCLSSSWKKQSSTVNIPKQLEEGKFELSPSATELHQARVKIESGEGELNIQFSDIWLTDGGVLQIRPLVVNRHTESLFRNIIAFEHCHRKGHDFRSYVIFMDCLINTPNDVNLLVNLKIINNSLGESQHVSTLFNNLYNVTMMHGNEFCHTKICSKLNEYSRDPLHQWKAKWFRAKVTLRRQYFGSPWSVISLLAAVMLLVLTFIQAVCSLKGLKYK